MMYANDTFWINTILMACEVDEDFQQLQDHDARRVEQTEVRTLAKGWITKRLSTEKELSRYNGDKVAMIEDWLRGLALAIPFQRWDYLDQLKDGGLSLPPEATLTPEEYVVCREI